LIPASLRHLAAVLGLVLLAGLLPVGFAAAAAADATGAVPVLAGPVDLDQRGDVLVASPKPVVAVPTSGRVLLQLDLGAVPHGVLTTGAARDRLSAVRSRVLSRVSAAGARSLRSYQELPFLSVEASAAALSALRATPGVLAVRSDEPHRPALAQTAPHIGAPMAWRAGHDGTGQTVAVLDSGVERSHPFLAGKVVAEACFAQSSTCPNGRTSQVGTGAAAPCTFDAVSCPHGTHVAGIVAGYGAASWGVARGSSIAAIQVFSRTTTGCQVGARSCAVGWTSDLLSGLDHVATLARSRPVAAVNLSLGGGSYTGSCDSAQPALKRAIDVLRGLGVVTVVSSGNESEAGAMASPACISTAVAVGSTSLADAVSSFSNSSSQLALLAPGERVLSSYVPGGTARMSGTSQAAPHVAGAFAVLKSKKPSATVTELLAAMTVSGVPVRDGRNGRTTPRVQVDAALETLTATATSAPSAPALVPGPIPGPSTSPVPPKRTPTDTAAPVRLSGTDRYDTAATVFSSAFGCASGGVSSAVLARGDAFADALAGSYLAGAQDTGVLLTATGSVPATTLAALRGSGASTVYLLGGTSAISTAAAAQLANTPSYDCRGLPGGSLKVVRISGSNRFDTARRTAEHAGVTAVGTADPHGSGTPLRTAVVASGLGFADALAAGPLSYGGAATSDHGDGRGFPTLLTAPSHLSPEAEAALVRLQVQQVIVPGGTAVVSPAVVSRMQALGLRVVRLAGSNRTATASLVADFAVDGLGFPRSGVTLARGDAFADALAGAAYAGDRAAALLLTTGPAALGAETLDYLHTAAGPTARVTAFGGTGAISDPTLAEAVRALVG